MNLIKKSYSYCLPITQKLVGDSSWLVCLSHDLAFSGVSWPLKTAFVPFHRLAFWPCLLWSSKLSVGRSFGLQRPWQNTSGSWLVNNRTDFPTAAEAGGFGVLCGLSPWPLMATSFLCPHVASLCVPSVSLLWVPQCIGSGLTHTPCFTWLISLDTLSPKAVSLWGEFGIRASMFESEENSVASGWWAIHRS